MTQPYYDDCHTFYKSSDNAPIMGFTSILLEEGTLALYSTSIKALVSISKPSYCRLSDITHSAKRLSTWLYTCALHDTAWKTLLGHPALCQCSDNPLPLCLSLTCHIILWSHHVCYAFVFTCMASAQIAPPTIPGQ